MRLATWNTAKVGLDAARSVMQTADIDILLLQEVWKPRIILPTQVWIGELGKLGILLEVRNGLEVVAEVPENGVPPYFVPFSVRGKFPLRVFGVWAKMHPEFKYIRGVAKALKVYGEWFGRQPVVVLGDFNSNALWDRKHPQNANHSAVVERLKNFGLESAYHTFRNEDFGKETSPTFYFHRKVTSAHHIDYCFVPSGWKGRIRSVEIPPYEHPTKISDHRPVIVEVAANGA